MLLWLVRAEEVGAGEVEAGGGGGGEDGGGADVDGGTDAVTPEAAVREA